MLNKHIRNPSSQQYAQADRGKSKNYNQPLHLINIRKRLSTKLSTSTNNQEEVEGLGGFRSMWHIPMIFYVLAWIFKNRHQPQPQPQPQPQQNESINITNMNYPSSPENTTALFNILNRAPTIQKRVYQGLHKSSTRTG